MSDNLKSGDKVKWSSHGGEAHGKVVKKQTEPTQIKGHKVAASKDDPHSSWRRTGASERHTSRPRSPRNEGRRSQSPHFSWKADIQKGAAIVPAMAHSLALQSFNPAAAAARASYYYVREVGA